MSVLYAGVICSVKMRVASGSGFLSGWYCSESARYAFLITDASAPTGTFRALYGSKCSASSTCENAMYAASAADTAQNASSHRLAPEKSARSLRAAVGRFLAARAAAALPHSDETSVGAATALAAAPFFSLSPYAASIAQLPTRHSVIGTRKNWMSDRRKMGNRFPCASVGSDCTIL